MTSLLPLKSLSLPSSTSIILLLLFCFLHHSQSVNYTRYTIHTNQLLCSFQYYTLNQSFYQCQYSYLDGYTHQNQSFNNCTTLCCNPNITYKNTPTSYRQCNKYWESQDTNIEDSISGIGLIVAMGFGGLVGLGIMACSCRLIWRRCIEQTQRRSLHLGARSEQNRRHLENLPNQISFSHLNHQIPNDFNVNQMQWKEHQIESIENTPLTNTCPVCLGEGPNVMLSCKHFYHASCIVAWLIRKNECSLCRTVNWNNFRLYCKSCSRIYVVTNFAGLQDKESFAVECKQCKNKSMMIQVQIQ